MSEIPSMSRTKKLNRQSSKQSGDCNTGVPTSPSVRASAATMRLFSVDNGDDDKNSNNADSDEEVDVETRAVADKLAGKNPRWITAQEKQRQADAVRNRIHALLTEIEAEGVKSELIVKKSWLQAKRLELRKIILKQPEDIVESEQFVGKVENMLITAAQKAKEKSAKKAQCKKKGESSGSDSDEDNRTETDEEQKEANKSDSDNSGEEPEGSSQNSEKVTKGNRKQEEAASANAEEEPIKDNKKKSKININKKTRVSYLCDTDEQKEPQRHDTAKNEQVTEESKQGDKDNNKSKDRTDSETLASGRRDPQSKDDVDDGKGDGKGGKSKKSKEQSKEVKDKPSNKDKRKENKEGNRKAKGEKGKDHSDEERSEWETETSKRKWKKPVIRFPSWKKGSDKSSKGTSAADRNEVEGDSAGGRSGSSGGRNDSGGSNRGGCRGGDGGFFWGERIDRPTESATKPKRRLSIDLHDKQPSDSDEEAPERQTTVFVLEIDASAGFSGDENVSEVAIKELPTSGKWAREKRKKKGESQTERNESVIPDIPVLQDSIKQKLRDTFSIKRKPKRSDTAVDQSDDGGGEEKGKKKEKAKGKKETSEKQKGKKDEAKGKESRATTDGNGSGSPMVIRAIESDSKKPIDSTPSWQGSSTTSGRRRIDDTMHCISLDDD